MERIRINSDQYKNNPGSRAREMVGRRRTSATRHQRTSQAPNNATSSHKRAPGTTLDFSIATACASTCSRCGSSGLFLRSCRISRFISCSISRFVCKWHTSLGALRANRLRRRRGIRDIAWIGQRLRRLVDGQKRPLVPTSLAVSRSLFPIVSAAFFSSRAPRSALPRPDIPCRCQAFRTVTP